MNLSPKRRLALAFTISAILGLAAAITATASVGKTASDCGYAFVYPSPIGSNQSEQDIQKGLTSAAQQLGVQVTGVENSTDASFGDTLRTLAAKGCYAAIGTAFFNYGQPLGDVAKEFPNQVFFIDNGPATEPNVVAYASKDEQGTFVAGAMAAKYTKTGKLGILLGLAIPSLNRFKNGFIHGAHFINPKLTVKVGVVGSFTDPAKGGTLAVAMASQGVDVIYPATGSNLDVYRLSKTNHYAVIGSDFVELQQALGSHPNVPFVVADDQAGTAAAILRDMVANHRTTGNVLIALKQGSYGIPWVNQGPLAGIKKPSAAVIAAGKRAYQAIVSGKATVPNPTG